MTRAMTAEEQSDSMFRRLARLEDLDHRAWERMAELGKRVEALEKKAEKHPSVLLWNALEHTIGRIDKLDGTMDADAFLQASREPFRMEAFDRIASALEMIAQKLAPSMPLINLQGTTYPQPVTNCGLCGRPWHPGHTC